VFTLDHVAAQPASRPVPAASAGHPASKPAAAVPRALPAHAGAKPLTGEAGSVGRRATAARAPTLAKAGEGVWEEF